jgi:NAD(P)-dependent dehydrogenase (short-subunit alcohol dehydrogenase family)
MHTQAGDRTEKILGGEIGADLAGCSRSLALELESTGIKVNAVSPGYTKTNLNGLRGDGKRLRRAPAKRCASRCSARTPRGTFTRWENETIPW